MTARSPTLWTLVAAAAIAALPGLHPWLVFERNAVLTGEVWRLFTGHWVHFGAGHLSGDLFVLGAAGLVLERRHRAAMNRIIVVAPWVIGAGLLALDPQLSQFGGLSGVASAALAAVALDALSGCAAERRLGALIVAAFASKLLAESLTGLPLLSGATGPAFQPVPLCHLLGALAGVLSMRAQRGPAAAIAG